MAIDLKVPSVGESITEVVVGEWLVKVGDHVEEDDPIVVIETDKATVELPAPAAGTLKEILKAEGSEAEVDEIIGTLEVGEGGATADETAKDDGKAEAAKGGGKAETEVGDQEQEEGGGEAGEMRITPAARRALAEAGLSAADVRATGPGGRLLKEDVQRHLTEKTEKSEKTTKQGEEQKHQASKESSEKSRPAQPGEPQGGYREEETVRMTTLRKTVARRLVAAQQEAALLTTFNEVDMSAVMDFRRRYKEAFQKKHGIKLGFMSFFVKAVIEGLKEIPALNAEIRDGNIVYKNYYDIGVAVGGGKGLVVPVIRNAERLSFAGVEKTIADLASRAQANELELEELQGGTFTISNGGIYGSMLSTPIINPPQSGILGMHNIKERPVAVDGEVVIRPIMYLAVSYDHRIVDGREAVTFLVRVKDCIEDPSRILVEV
jgi:2-oxoglutarate dehydrogenase E2 component (dihydrolipoamide succinyltransferase)